MSYPIALRSLFIACLLSSANAFAKPLLHFSGKQGQPVEIADYSYSIPASRPLTIGLSFGSADAQRLRDLMRSNVDSQVAVKIGDQTTMTPIVRDVPVGTSLDLSLSDAKTFEAVKSALKEPTTP